MKNSFILGMVLFFVCENTGSLKIHILCFYFEFCEVMKPDPGICIKKLIS